MATSFSLVQLGYFAETARAGSMSVAAKRLHVSQPALSSAISQLERDLGADLFTRVPRRGVTLTRLGRQFFEDAVLLIAQAEAMEASVTRVSNPLGGQLRVGIYQPMTPVRAPQLLRAFSQKHPQVRVDLVEADQEELMSLLQSHQIDVALSYAMIPFPGMTSEPLEEIAPHAILPVTHPLAQRSEPVRLEELAADPMVLLDLSYTGGYYLGLFRDAGLEPNVRFRVSGYETVRAMVAAGFGFSLLNQRIHHDLVYSGNAVTVKELADDAAALEVQLVAMPDGPVPELVEAFSAVCRQVYAS